MIRYATKARGYVEDSLYEYENKSTTSCTVDGESHTDTGLLDKDGFSIYRLSNQVGFHAEL